MRLGDPVNGLMMDHHWRFVLDDQHRIAEAVKRENPKARLVAHDQTQEIAVARFIEREHLGEGIDALVGAPVTDRGGAYLLVFYPRRGDGSKMVGEPDHTVIDQMRERDMWARLRGVNERQLLDQFQKLEEARQAALDAMLLERLQERTARRMHDFAKKYGLPWAPGRAFIGRGIPVGRG